MKKYSFTEARQNFAAVLKIAKREGVVLISKRDGESFYIKPAVSKKSPLDIEGVDLHMSVQKIVNAVRESRVGKYT